MNRLPAKTSGPIQARQENRATDPIDHARREDQRPRPVPSLKLLRLPAVRDRTGLSRSTIWRLERHGAFPQHRRISPNAVAWVEEEVMSWIQSKIGNIAV